jgi:hypothetical protein
MVIGGFALPSYGTIRTTVDLDIAVRIGTKKEFVSFVAGAKRSGFDPGVSSFANPAEVFRDTKTGLEIEFWLRPDGIEWDAETLRRRTKATIGKVRVWLVSPEDFVISKLARPDRGVQDEKDVVSVLRRLRSSLDRRYIERRAREAAVLAVLRSLEEASKRD